MSTDLGDLTCKAPPLVIIFVTSMAGLSRPYSEVRAPWRAYDIMGADRGALARWPAWGPYSTVLGLSCLIRKGSAACHTIGHTDAVPPILMGEAFRRTPV
jgi:hypothetical protein